MLTTVLAVVWCLHALPGGALFEADVVNAAGETVAGAEAAILEADAVRWLAASDGRIELARNAFPGKSGTAELHGTFTLVVRAPGYATRLESIAVPASARARVTLARGKTITMTVENDSDRDLPAEFAPVVSWSPYGFQTWVSVLQGKDAGQRLSFAALDRVDEDHVRFQVPDDLAAFFVIVDEPGFLRGFQAGPFATASLADGAVALSLPAPGTVRVEFHPPAGATLAQPPRNCGVSLSRYIDQPADANAFYGLGSREERGPALDASFEDLAPGTYNVDVYTGTTATRYNPNRADLFNDQQRIELASGEQKKVDFVLGTFDPAILQGDYALRAQITKQDGSPAAGLDYTLNYSDSKFGRRVVASGKVPADGVIALQGLPGGARALSFDLQVGSESLGRIELAGDQRERTVAFRIPPGTGDVAPNLSLTDVFTQEKLDLASFRGQVVFVDFWATWCGPCQEPMAHNSEILTRRARDWEGKATILGLSIDQERELVVDHVRVRHWDNVRHVWAHEGKGWQSVAVKSYGINGVPTAFLLDRAGKIVWRGHPASFDVEKQIDELLASH